LLLRQPPPLFDPPDAFANELAHIHAQRSADRGQCFRASTRNPEIVVSPSFLQASSRCSSVEVVGYRDLARFSIRWISTDFEGNCYFPKRSTNGFVGGEDRWRRRMFDPTHCAGFSLCS
jgi:hypothetical protein